MKFSTAEPFTRFFFNNVDEKDGWIDLRALSLDKSKEIRKKTIKKRIEFKRGQRFEVEDVNTALRDKETFDYCIGEWSKVEDDKGQEYENTLESKLTLMAHSVPFANYVTDKLDFLSDQQLAHDEAAGKNSGTSPGQQQSEK